MAVELRDDQLKAIDELRNGSILCGGVGSGKSRTALGYYLFKVCEGDAPVIDETFHEVLPFKHSQYEEMEKPRDLYIITTAKKRDSLEWNKEGLNFLLNPGQPENNLSGVNVTVDSWNNIKKYQKIYGAFFIFDEQRVCGSGVWVKAFLNITRKNQWILLSATPGDSWSDYIPVFIANGFYKNKTEFNARHCVFARYSKYPKIERYIGERTLRQYRDSILVHMECSRTAVRIKIPVIVDYDRELFRTVYRDRWDPYENCPIQESGKWVYLMRRVINSDSSRIEKAKEIVNEQKRVIIFYNYTYELELLRDLCEEMEVVYAEWNGQKHEDLPITEEWVYLVQYTAGCEGWNCITSNTIIFFSQSYSYRQTEQAAGRIDRINTPYNKLYYYHFRSRSFIDMMIYQKLKNKQNFNESSLRFDRR